MMDGADRRVLIDDVRGDLVSTRNRIDKTMREILALVLPTLGSQGYQRQNSSIGNQKDTIILLVSAKYSLGDAEEKLEMLENSEH